MPFTANNLYMAFSQVTLFASPEIDFSSLFNTRFPSRAGWYSWSQQQDEAAKLAKLQKYNDKNARMVP